MCMSPSGRQGRRGVVDRDPGRVQRHGRLPDGHGQGDRQRAARRRMGEVRSVAGGPDDPPEVRLLVSVVPQAEGSKSSESRSPRSTRGRCCSPCERRVSGQAAAQGRRSLEGVGDRRVARPPVDRVLPLPARPDRGAGLPCASIGDLGADEAAGRDPGTEAELLHHARSARFSRSSSACPQRSCSRRARSRGTVSSRRSRPCRRCSLPRSPGSRSCSRMGVRGSSASTSATYGIRIPFTTTAVVMAQLFVAAPFFVNTARAGLEQLQGRYETAAYTLRASRFQAFRSVVLPLTSPVLLTAVGLAWARALGEFGATITFAGNFPGVTQTLPIAVYISSQSDFDKSIAISVILLAVSFAVLTTLGSDQRPGCSGAGRSDACSTPGSPQRSAPSTSSWSSAPGRVRRRYCSGRAARERAPCSGSSPGCCRSRRGGS